MLTGMEQTVQRVGKWIYWGENSQKWKEANYKDDDLVNKFL